MMKKEKHLNKYTCIVIGPMNFPWKLIKTSMKTPDTLLFFVDGGTIHLEKFKKYAPFLLKNAVTIGDGDSSKIPMKIKKKDQNLSDLAFFLQKMQGKNTVSAFHFLGFLGGRIDHELFNLGEIAHFLENSPINGTPKIFLNNQIQFLTKGTHVLEVQGSFSLAAFSANKIKISGDCHYKAPDWIDLPALSSRGLSNQGHGLIKIETKKVLAVILG